MLNDMTAAGYTAKGKTMVLTRGYTAREEEEEEMGEAKTSPLLLTAMPQARGRRPAAGKIFKFFSQL